MRPLAHPPHCWESGGSRSKGGTSCAISAILSSRVKGDEGVVLELHPVEDGVPVRERHPVELGVEIRNQGVALSRSALDSILSDARAANPIPGVTVAHPRPADVTEDLVLEVVLYLKKHVLAELIDGLPAPG